MNNPLCKNKSLIEEYLQFAEFIKNEKIKNCVDLPEIRCKIARLLTNMEQNQLLDARMWCELCAIR